MKSNLTTTIAPDHRALFLEFSSALPQPSRINEEKRKERERRNQTVHDSCPRFSRSRSEMRNPVKVIH